MDNQEKYSKNKKCFPKAEKKTFLQWKSLDASKEKLDEKEDKKTIVLWKKLAIAASLYCFLIGIPVY
jgi:Ca-activated chloride channel family protein